MSYSWGRRGGRSFPGVGSCCCPPPPLPVQDYCLAPWEHWGLQLGNHHLLESCDGPATLGDTSAFAGGRGRTRQGCNRNQTSVGFADLLLLFGFGFGFVFFFITQELKNNHKQEPCPGVGEGGEAALPHHIRFTRVAPTPALPCPLRLHKTPFPPKKNPFPPPSAALGTAGACDEFGRAQPSTLNHPQLGGSGEPTRHSGVGRGRGEVQTLLPLPAQGRHKLSPTGMERGPDPAPCVAGAQHHRG